MIALRTTGVWALTRRVTSANKMASANVGTKFVLAIEILLKIPAILSTSEPTSDKSPAIRPDLRKRAILDSAGLTQPRLPGSGDGPYLRQPGFR
jgi:hypothetical protein